MSTCPNNPEKSSTAKINKHTPSGYSLFTYCSFDLTKNKLDCYRDKEHATKIINYEKKEMISLTDEENKSHEKHKVCYVCKKGFSIDDDDNKKYHKVSNHCHYTRKYRGAELLIVFVI